MTTSISPRISFHSTFDISPRLGTLGKRVARTALQNGSISLKATASQPSGPHAQLAASMPENHEAPFPPRAAALAIDDTLPGAAPSPNTATMLGKGAGP